MVRSAALAGALALMTGCTTPGAEPPAPTSLTGTTWRLEALQSSDDNIGTVRPDDPAKYEMTLGADGRASLRLDCNRATGDWESPGTGQLTFKPLAMTRAACPAGSLDTRVARELGFVRTYVLEGDRLILNLMADAGNQTWRRVPN